MEITWYGHSCFRITERKMATVVTDPYDHNIVGYSPLNLTGNIITISHDEPGHNNTTAVKGKPQMVIAGPGEYEIGGVFVTAVQTNGKRKPESNDGRNILYVFNYDDVSVAHLGDLDRVPTQTEIEMLGTVNIALVPVGGGRGLNAAKAAEVVSMLEPGYVIPMHFSTPESKLELASVDRFMKEMGIGEIEAVPSLKVTKTSVPEETKVILLAYKS